MLISCSPAGNSGPRAVVMLLVGEGGSQEAAGSIDDPLPRMMKAVLSIMSEACGAAAAATALLLPFTRYCCRAGVVQLSCT